MRFEWDEAKSDANLEERGCDRRKDYGERRMVAIGVADGLHLTVVYTDRENVSGQVTRRIISARRSSRHERTIYQKSHV